MAVVFPAIFDPTQKLSPDQIPTSTMIFKEKNKTFLACLRTLFKAPKVCLTFPRRLVRAKFGRKPLFATGKAKLSKVASEHSSVLYSVSYNSRETLKLFLRVWINTGFKTQIVVFPAIFDPTQKLSPDQIPTRKIIFRGKNRSSLVCFRTLFKAPKVFLKTPGRPSSSF